MKLLIVPTLTLSLIAGCSTLPQGTTIRYTTNEVVEAVLTPVGAVGPTHEVRRQQITMTLVPKGQGKTNIVLMAAALPAPPLPLLRSTPLPRAKSVSGLPPMPTMTKTTTKPIVFQLVCNSKDGGMVFSTNGSLSGLVFTNASVSFTNFPSGKAKFPPQPLRRSRRAKTVISPNAPVLSGFWIPWDADNNILFVDNMNLKNGSNYTDQTTLDLKVWGDLTHFTWTDTDPSSYNRVAVVVPATVNAFKAVRAKMQ